MIPRRRILQAAAAVPAIGLLPAFARPVSAAGTPVGAGMVVDTEGLTGFSLSWTGTSHRGATVRALWGG